jgi:ketosteroid isomerase-like protein
MSQENVDRFLEGNEAFNRGDVERWVATYHPDAVFEPQVAALEGRYSGHDGLRRFFADVADTLEMFEMFEFHYPDVRDLGDRVLALGTLRGTGKGSGIATEVPLAVVATFRDGLCTHLKDYGEWRQALEAAGLRE